MFSTSSQFSHKQLVLVTAPVSTGALFLQMKNPPIASAELPYQQGDIAIKEFYKTTILRVVC
jgi:hypothetical protein